MSSGNTEQLLAADAQERAAEARRWLLLPEDNLTIAMAGLTQKVVQ